MKRLDLETLASLCTYGASVIEETVKFGGYKIEFLRDDYAEKPHERCEFVAPYRWQSQDSYPYALGVCPASRADYLENQESV